MAYCGNGLSQACLAIAILIEHQSKPQFASPETVNHCIREYGRIKISNNTVEGFYPILKHGMKGIYQHCCEAHLHRYLGEFYFRYSRRVKLGYSNMDRANTLFKGIVGN